jgi:ribosomal protein S18 acetylase RimI-like enzyme
MNSPNTKPMFSHRPVQDGDLPLICQFPQNEQELFFMFPKADYPLTIEQIRISIDQRWDSTVVLLDQKVVGFANFYAFKPGESCSIGNVVVSPHTRGKGAGRYLINTMIKIASAKYQVKKVLLSCFNQNINGLLLYNRLGFKPISFEERVDKQGIPVISIHMEYEVIPG